nr:hypothetical protein [Pseudomonas kurunegalensis]
MDVSLQKRATEFEESKLPKNLTKLVYQSGRQRSDFTDYREWKLYSLLYEALLTLRGHDEFAVLAVRLFAYLDRHPPTLKPIDKPIRKTLTRKEKRRLRAERVDGKTRNLSPQLKKAKPSHHEKIKAWKASPTIGLGLETKLLPPPKARREDVIIDKHTKPSKDPDRSHILYAAGWSLSPERSQD